MENSQRERNMVKIIGIVTGIYCVLMLGAVLWTMYGPFTGTNFTAVVEIKANNEPHLLHERYFLSPYFVHASLSISVRNLPTNLLKNGQPVECPYRVLERTKFGSSVLEGKDCRAVGNYQSAPESPSTRISEDMAITYVRSYPAVQAFIREIEDTYKDNRRVSFKVTETPDKQYFIVTVAESDDINETPWNQYQVKKDGSEILVVNTLTSELQPLEKPTVLAPKPQAKVPADFSVSYYESGGMAIWSAELLVTSTGALYKVNDGSVRTEQYFTFSQTEIEALHQALKDNRFSEIKTYTEMVYDRGGSSITYTVNNQTSFKSNSGIHFIKKDGSEFRFAAVEKMLIGLIKKYDQKNLQ